MRPSHDRFSSDHQDPPLQRTVPLAVAYRLLCRLTLCWISGDGYHSSFIRSVETIHRWSTAQEHGHNITDQPPISQEDIQCPTFPRGDVLIRDGIVTPSEHVSNAQFFHRQMSSIEADHQLMGLMGQMPWQSLMLTVKASSFSLLPIMDM